ncbi:restriction endonuclease subunit S [Streptomyces sp. NPDC053253]|uniref:restriction endonuclease subunit S n=1 Tax=Streptomyces sp. NPDC053253 TaxID=3365699 RepID=UPI0037D14CD2
MYREHGVVKRSGREDNFNKAAPDRNIYQLVHPGWLVVNRMKAWQGSVGISPYRGIVSGHYICFRPKHQEENSFLNWLLRSAIYATEFASLSRGVRPGQVEIDNDLLRVLSVKLPSVDEQRRIADFLDAEVAQIDGLVKLRERQLDLLAEAGVSRVFAAIRGENVPGVRKDSGLLWLGDVPKEWPVAAVAHFFDVDLGKMLNPERARGVHMRPYLRVANVQWGEVSTDDLVQMDFPPEERRRYGLQQGDLLVCEGGSWPGRAAIWDGAIQEIYYQKALHRLRPRGNSLTGWLYYCLMAAERLNVFAAQGNTSTMTHLTREQLRPQRFPFPDVEVQRRTVAELDSAARADSELRRVLTRQLASLAERRQALITAAVTGQLDVTSARPAHDRDL